MCVVWYTGSSTTSLTRNANYQTLVWSFPLFPILLHLLLNIMVLSNFLPQDTKAYAEENGLLFMETSAKTGENVKEIFHAIGKATH